MTAGASISERPLPLPQVLVFDVDGTLIDTLRPMRQALNEVLAASGLPPWSEATVREHLSLGLQGLLSTALRTAGPMPPGGCERASLSQLLQRYLVLAPRQARCFDGASAMLDQARAAGCRLAVCSNAAGPVLQALFEAQGWHSLFDAVVHAGNAVALKPSGQPLTQVLAQLGVSPAQAWLIGDSALDAACAQAAGSAFVWFSGGYGGVRPQAVAAQVDALDGVIELLDRARRRPDPISSGQRR
jgi:phosphoglycolate phosphatase